MRCATCSTSTRAPAGTTARRSARSGKHAGLEPKRSDHGARRRVHRLRRRRAARPLRRERRGPEPALPERPARRRGSGSGSTRSARREGVADPNAGMGIAAGRLRGDGRPDLFVTNSRGQTPRGLSQPGRRAVHRSRRPSRVAAAVGTRSTGWGASWVDLDLDGDLDLVARERRDPGHEPREGRAADPSARERRVEQRGRDFAPIVGADARPARQRARPRRSRLRQRRRPGPRGQLDRRKADAAARTRGGSGHWLEVQLPDLRARRRRHRDLPDGRGSSSEVHAGSSYLSSEDPRVHFGLGDGAPRRSARALPEERYVRQRASRAGSARRGRRRLAAGLDLDRRRRSCRT